MEPVRSCLGVGGKCVLSPPVHSHYKMAEACLCSIVFSRSWAGSDARYHLWFRVLKARWNLYSFWRYKKTRSQDHLRWHWILPNGITIGSRPGKKLLQNYVWYFHRDLLKDSQWQLQISIPYSVTYFGNKKIHNRNRDIQSYFCPGCGFQTLCYIDFLRDEYNLMLIMYNDNCTRKERSKCC